MQPEEKTQIVESIFRIIVSDPYKLRLANIHKHYPNLKSESRYRDALLELFNDEQERLQSGLRAYAEADRVDMVVTSAGPDDGIFHRLRIEFKYHFTYDMYHRVARHLAAFRKVRARGNVEQVRALAKGDLRGIALDCLAPKGDAECDLFILVVQDRQGAADPAGQNPTAAGRIAKVHQRGVPIHFLDEQIKFDRLKRKDAWIEPLHAMLSHIHFHRHFRLIPAQPHVMPNHPAGVPLTSHIIGLDFSVADAVFPANPQALFR